MKVSILEGIFTVIGLILVLFFSILIFKITDYSILAIGSNSMKEYLNKGDAVIYQTLDIVDVKVGDVIVFKLDGILIIHRIVKISNDGDKIIISTKGDNNKDIDGFEVTDKNFVGKVLFKIKFIGWPAVLISEILE